jgi:hypothetical protein
MKNGVVKSEKQGPQELDLFQKGDTFFQTAGGVVKVKVHTLSWHT